MTLSTAAAATICPAPPPDFNKRSLPIKLLDLRSSPLQRIYRTGHEPVYFNKPGMSKTRFRFDAPNDEFGVLYASQHFEACVAETIIRNRFAGGALPLQIEEREISSRSIAKLTTASGHLRLADLAQPLVHLGGSAQILSDPNYLIPNRWSLAIEGHPEGVDGIYFISRYANQASVAIFDRTLLTQDGLSIKLIDSPEMAAYLDRYDIGLL